MTLMIQASAVSISSYCSSVHCSGVSVREVSVSRASTSCSSTSFIQLRVLIQWHLNSSQTCVSQCLAALLPRDVAQSDRSVDEFHCLVSETVLVA